MRTIHCAATILGLLITAIAFSGPVNINTADAATLARELKGIGAAKAQAIVEHRQKHGAFRSLDELALVKGIGQKLVDRNRADLRIERAAAPAAPAVTGTAATRAPPPAATRR
jgi:competence protein ComEA